MKKNLYLINKTTTLLSPTPPSKQTGIQILASANQLRQPGRACPQDSTNRSQVETEKDLLNPLPSGTLAALPIFSQRLCL